MDLSHTPPPTSPSANPVEVQDVDLRFQISDFRSLIVDFRHFAVVSGMHIHASSSVSKYTPFYASFFTNLRHNLVCNFV